MRIVERDRIMQCSLCNKETHKTILTTIKLAHKVEIMYVCPECKAKRDREYYEEYSGHKNKKKEEPN